MDAVLDRLFREVRKSYKENSTIDDDLLLSLKFIFQAPSIPALDLVDRRNVTRLVSRSGRVIYQVTGSSGSVYTCFENSVFCNCPAFRFSVLKRHDYLMCKHVLALKLSDAMDVTNIINISDEEAAQLLEGKTD